MEMRRAVCVGIMKAHELWRNCFCWFLVRNSEGRIRLYCKGADIVLFERLHPCNQELMSITLDHLNVSSLGCLELRCHLVSADSLAVAAPSRWNPDVSLVVRLPPLTGICAGLQEYAADGLRTLVLAYRDLTEEQWEAWSESHHGADKAASCREESLAAAYEEIEQDMMVSGLT